MHDCVQNCALSDYAEVYDDTLAIKWKTLKKTKYINIIKI
jgi:hypothetical protein